MRKSAILSLAALLCSVQLIAAVPAGLKHVKLTQIAGKQVLEAKNAEMPVLGYFDETATELPEMQSFLAFYDEAVRRIEAGAAPDEVFLTIANAQPGDTVGPLLGGIKYGQGDPFNKQCPNLNGEGRSVTGCVATAMAQVMRYYKHPACGTGVCSYTGSAGKKDFDMAAHPFDWTNMLESYSGSFTTTQANAVANLMLACGASVNMSYSADGSGSQADKAAVALKTNFNYPKAKSYETTIADEAMRQDVLVVDWAETLRDNFDVGHPVIYAGSSGNGITGHCFVVDGYVMDEQGNTYFHINWGWEGTDDGWFLITCFQPNPHETNYSGYRNTMVVNIYPEGWTAVESVEAGAGQVGFDPSQPVYNLLGLRIAPEHMIHGQIYVQKGTKFLW